MCRGWFKKKEPNDNMAQSQKESSSVHSAKYTTLLETYIFTTKVSSIVKIVLKCCFFIVAMGALSYVTYYFGKTLDFSFSIIGKNQSAEGAPPTNMEEIAGVIAVIIPAISSLIVAFIKIPEIIAKYLFNIEEDSHTNAIIKSIQDYDVKMYEMESQVERIRVDEIKAMNKSGEPQTDGEYQELPAKNKSQLKTSEEA